MGGAGFTLAPAAVTRVNDHRCPNWPIPDLPAGASSFHASLPMFQLMSIALDSHAERNSIVGEIRGDLMNY
jgi:hypothetical protein